MRACTALAIRVVLLGLLWPAHAGDAIGAEPARSAYSMTAPRSPDMAQVPRLIVQYANELRKANGLQPTAVSEPLSRAAGYFADFMARSDRHGHEADGSTPAARAKQHGYNFCMILENIAYQFHSAGFATEELARRFVEGWERSPGHRRNMLDPHVLETGTAIARSTRTGRYYAVQMFGRPQSAMIAFQIENQAGDSVRYQLAGKAFDLPPRTTTTHEQCVAPEVVVQGGQEDRQLRIRPANGDRFAVVRNRLGLSVVRQ